MIDARRRLAQARRDVAREPLARLVGIAIGHALVPLVGQQVDAALLARGEVLAKVAVAELADAGALAYFGIRSRYEIDPSRDIWTLGVLRANRCPVCWLVPWVKAKGGDWLCGHVAPDAYTIAEWIMDGPTRTGWKPGNEITAAMFDLSDEGETT